MKLASCFANFQELRTRLTVEVMFLWNNVVFWGVVPGRVLHLAVQNKSPIIGLVISLLKYKCSKSPLDVHAFYMTMEVAFTILSQFHPSSEIYDFS